MRFHFTLCPECQAKYGALRFDPGAKYGLNIMPLCSLIWPDEHPDGTVVTNDDGKHEQCRAAVIRLAWARTQLWRTGSIPEESRALWEEAQRALPEWPGFQRLALDRQQMASLDGCAEELGDFMRVVQRDFPHIETTDEGGGLGHFSARRAQTPSPRRWWQLWK
jgi:hypothetical protein